MTEWYERSCQLAAGPAVEIHHTMNRCWGHYAMVYQGSHSPTGGESGVQSIVLLHETNPEGKGVAIEVSAPPMAPPNCLLFLI